jgi:selenocysteine lyase/cysteine desulfurase
LFGGTGSHSVEQAMPDFLPDRLEAGTLNVPGIAGLMAGMCYVNQVGVRQIFQREHRQLENCVGALKKMGFQVFSGKDQSGTVSFVPNIDCEIFAEKLSARKIAVRAGLHCAPTAHESAGTLETGTVRVSFGHDASDAQSSVFLRAVSTL